MPSKQKAVTHNLFDRTSFGELMRNAESNRSEAADEDRCHECGEHMLDCECEEEEVVT